MQIDIGNNKIHTNFSSIVLNKEIEDLQRSIGETDNDRKRDLSSSKRRHSRYIEEDPHHANRRPSSKGSKGNSESKDSRRVSHSRKDSQDIHHTPLPVRLPPPPSMSNPQSPQAEAVPAEEKDNKTSSEKKEVNEKAPRPPPRLAETKVQAGMFLKNWLITERIGAGSFGETFTAVEVENPPPTVAGEDIVVTPEGEAMLANLPPKEQRKEVCVKVEPENKNVLRMEALALKKVQPCPQVVRYYASGCTSGMNFLVMEKLGANLAELRRQSPHGTFNIYTTLKAGISCLRAIRGVHEQGLVHRDIKPSNFVIGLKEKNDEQTCYLIDFGLARRFQRSNGDIRPPRDNAGFRGTSRYASVASHHHQELGRVDDIWSLLFMLVEFATGTLPWRKFKEKDEIGQCKEDSINPHLVRNLPREFQAFLAHLQVLQYEDEPDYDLLLGLMKRALERRGYPADKLVDWQLDPETLAMEEEEAERKAKEKQLLEQQQQQQRLQDVPQQIPPPRTRDQWYPSRHPYRPRNDHSNLQAEGGRPTADTPLSVSKPPNGHTPARKGSDHELSSSNYRLGGGLTPGNGNPPTLENFNMTPGNVLPNENSYTPAVQASTGEEEEVDVDDDYSPRDKEYSSKMPTERPSSGYGQNVEPLEASRSKIEPAERKQEGTRPTPTAAQQEALKRKGNGKPLPKEELKAKAKSKCDCSVM